MISKKDIQNYVIGHYVSNDDASYDELIVDGKFHADVIIWEPFENHSYDDILDMIQNQIDSMIQFLLHKGVEITYDDPHLQST